MQNLLLGVAAATALFSASATVGVAKAEPAPQLIFGVDRAGDMPSLDRVQFIFGGHNFCWYDSGWSGPGFYWCGYATRRGYGWGGGSGWNGWQGGRGGGVQRGGQVARGGDAHAGGERAAVSHGAAGQGGHGGAAHAAAAHPAAAHAAAAHASAGHGGGDKKPGA